MHHALSELPRGQSGRLAEGGRKGGRAVETAIPGDDLDRRTGLTQQLLRPVDLAVGDVAGERLSRGYLELSEEMAGGKAAFRRQLGDGRGFARLLDAIVDALKLGTGHAPSPLPPARAEPRR